MFLRLILLFIILLCPMESFSADWTADGDCMLAYRFDEASGTTAIDDCGSNDGTIHTEQRIAGRFRGGLNLSNTYITVGDVTFLDGKNTATFGFFMKTSIDFGDGTTVPTPEHIIFDKNGSFVLADNYAFTNSVFFTTSSAESIFASDNYITSATAWDSGTSYVRGQSVSYGGKLYTCYLDNTNKQPDTNEPDWLISNFISEDASWHFYMVTYDGTVRKHYRDCVQVGASYSDTGNFANSSNIFSIGARDVSEGGPNYPAHGDWDDFIILDRALDTTECTDLMNNGIDGTAGHDPVMFKGNHIKLYGTKINGT